MNPSKEWFWILVWCFYAHRYIVSVWFHFSKMVKAMEREWSWGGQLTLRQTRWNKNGDVEKLDLCWVSSSGEYYKLCLFVFSPATDWKPLQDERLQKIKEWMNELGHFKMEVNGDWLTFGASFKWPCVELQFNGTSISPWMFPIDENLALPKDN